MFNQGQKDMSTVTLWTLICASLVFFMQAGFCCLEAGIIRTKNSANVAIKNIADFSISFSLFWLFGYALMFGESFYGVLGTNMFVPGATSFLSIEDSAKFLFQAVFCTTAVTIFSGAVAERMSFRGFMFLAFFVSAFIYPVVGHWVWNPGGWLKQMGVYDFAGVLVVHCVGGWIALAAVLNIGPRIGRFPEETGKPVEFTPFNLPLSVLGVLILAFGWIGFNGGSTTMPSHTGYVILNTLVAGFAGSSAILLIALLRNQVVSVIKLGNGILAGLVSVTGCAEIILVGDAVLIGLVGGLVMYTTSLLLMRFKIDDAIDAIPVHLGAGIWGMFSVALFGDLEMLAETRMEAFYNQAVATVVCGVWVFGVSFIFIKCVSHFIPVRVSEENERLGLNISEHGQKHPMRDLLNTMNQQAITGDMSLRVDPEPFTEAEEVAFYYNKALDTIQKTTDGLERAVDNRTRELEKEKEKAEKANESKSEFLANMSHELRTPLNSIIGMVQLLKTDILDEEAKDTFELIRASSINLLDIVNDILDLSKIEAGEISLEYVAFDAIQKIRHTVQSMKPMAHDKNIELFYHQGDVSSLYTLGDQLRFVRIMTNLVGNAVRYTKKGCIDVGFEVKEHLGDQVKLRVYVKDTGVGISKEKVGKIFEKFTQADSSITRKFGGTGLGLTITKELVELMDGQIGVESELGVGSTFWFEIPFEVIDELPEEGTSPRVRHGELVSTIVTPVTRARVLVAEDNLMNQKFIQKLFKKFGISHYKIVGNGRDAVQEVQSHNYDAVLMDFHMPEMNGYDATRAIRQLPDPLKSDIPIVAMTANAMPEDERKSLEIGMDAYISKPIKIEVFVDKLSEWFRFDDEESKESSIFQENMENSPVNLDSLRENGMGDEEFIKEMIGLFVSQGAEQIRELKEHCVDGKSELWVEIAHALKGTSGQVWAETMRSLCDEAQNMSDSSAEARKVIIDHIDKEYVKVKEYFISQNLYKT